MAAGHSDPPGRSMYLRLRHGRTVLQEIEVAAGVGLADVLLEHAAVAALVAGRQRHPGGAALRQLRVRDAEVQVALSHVDLDLIAGPDESQRPADEALRRHVQDAGAVAGAR